MAAAQDPGSTDLEGARAAAALALIEEESQYAAAVFGRAHWRVNGRQLFTAVACAVRACSVSAQISVTGPDPSALFNLGAAVGGALAAVATAFRTGMLPLDYVACLVLSECETPVTVEELRSRMLALLESMRSANLPWYLRLSREGCDDVEAALSAADAAAQLRAVLQKSECASWDRASDRFSYRRVDFVWGLWPNG